MAQHEPQAVPVGTIWRPAEFTHAVNRLSEEYRGRFNRETVERALIESTRAFATAKVPNYVPLFAEQLTRERLGARAHGEGTVAVMPSVLFLCVHNAGRSQMAAGWLRALSGGRALAYSAGSEPASAVNAMAVEAMSEVGIDLAQEFPKPWTEDLIQSVDVVVTMGCGDACPVYPGVRYVDWSVDDPAGQGLGAVRRIRDDIEQRVRALLRDLDVATE